MKENEFRERLTRLAGDVPEPLHQSYMHKIRYGKEEKIVKKKLRLAPVMAAAMALVCAVALAASVLTGTPDDTAGTAASELTGTPEVISAETADETVVPEETEIAGETEAPEETDVPEEEESVISEEPMPGVFFTDSAAANIEFLYARWTRPEGESTTHELEISCRISAKDPEHVAIYTLYQTLDESFTAPDGKAVYVFDTGDEDGHGLLVMDDDQMVLNGTTRTAERDLSENSSFTFVWTLRPEDGPSLFSRYKEETIMTTMFLPYKVIPWVEDDPDISAKTRWLVLAAPVTISEND